MPQYDITITRQIEIQTPGFSSDQMRDFGQEAIQAMIDRNKQGIDTLGQRSKPLGEKYARRKSREGKQPIRDLRFTGNMLGSLHVVSATEREAVVRVEGATPIRKGIFNQNIDPWFGLSEAEDEPRVRAKVEDVFAQNIKALNSR